MARSRSRSRKRSRSRSRKMGGHLHKKTIRSHARSFRRIKRTSKSKAECERRTKSKVFKLYKQKKLASHGRRVLSRKQAIAIALNKSRNEC